MADRNRVEIMMRSNKIIIFSLVLISSIFMFNFFAAAESTERKKIYVPKDYKTIKEAIENSNSGDLVYIAEGNYEELCALGLKRGVEIYGEGADKTKLLLRSGGIGLGGKNVIKGISFNLAIGEIYLNCADDVTLQNCIIFTNSGASNGLRIEKSENVKIINCTIVNFRDGISIRYPPSDVLIKNSIISNNKNACILISDEVVPGSFFDPMTGKIIEPYKKGGEIKVTLEYNDVWGSSKNYYGISAGEHDISKDPKFVSESNYRLQSGSPCIGAGDPDSKYNDPDGSRNDIGALPH